MTESSTTRVPSSTFWSGRRVLMTGHTGFKGSWLTTWLNSLGAVVGGISLPELPSAPALWADLDVSLAADIRADIAGDEWQEAAADFEPEILIHLAAQPLVSHGYTEPLRTFETNVLGTAKVLDATAQLPLLQAVLVATTDKVYDTSGPPPYGESAPLGGKDPYAASKAGAEFVLASWPNLRVSAATARAGNVIGGGDWATDRLVPDLVRAWSVGATPALRQPHAVRPWQHVIEPLCGYLVYLEDLATGADVPRTLNFGPSSLQSVPVHEVASHAAVAWGLAFAGVPRSFDLLAESAMPETGFLEIDSTLAGESLGWHSVLDWRTAVSMTIDWYAAWGNGVPAGALIREQLHQYSDSVGR